MGREAGGFAAGLVAQTDCEMEVWEAPGGNECRDRNFSQIDLNFPLLSGLRERLFGIILGVEYAGVSFENQDLAKALQNEICEGSAHVHATMAKVAKACAKFDEIGGCSSPSATDGNGALALAG